MERKALIALTLAATGLAAHAQTSRWNRYQGINGGYDFDDRNGNSTGHAQWNQFSGVNGGWDIYNSSRPAHGTLTALTA